MADRSPLERTPEAARSAVEAVYAEFHASSDDDLVKRVVTQEVVDEVFRLAWRFQFDEERGQVRNKVRDVVSDRVTEVGEAGATP